MSVHYESRYALGPVETKGLDTTGLRENFLIETVFADDEIRLVYTHYDRYIAGGAKPVSKPVKLETIDALTAPYFIERSELGIINVGGSGQVTVDGKASTLKFTWELKEGKGNNEVGFQREEAAHP